MKAIVSIFFLLATLSTFPQVGFSPKIDSISNLVTTQSLSLVNRELSGDIATTIGGAPYTILSRNANSPHNLKAAQFILERFQSFGLNARYMNYSASGTNIIATKLGSKYPNLQYVICGHYDNMPTGNLAPGADDNASGTCSVLEAARLLAPYSYDYTLIFVAFDEEEYGLYGSRAYADSSYYKGDSILGVLNFDMIAWDGNNDNKINIFSNNNSVSFADIARFSFNVYQPLLNITFAVGNMSGSDHYSFWQKGYKAICGIELTSDFNPYYHSINDNFSNINMPFFLKFTRAALASLMTFGWDYIINFNHTPIIATNETTPRVAAVVINSRHRIKKLVNGPRLYYKVNGGSLNPLNYDYNNLDTFKFTIPGQNIGSVVDYYFAAQDSLANFVGTLPLGGKGLNPPGSIPPPTFLQYTVLSGIAVVNETAKYELNQNYPNPFNPVTNIEFTLGSLSNVRIIVNDVLGREVVELLNQRYPAGSHRVMFDGKHYSSGVYYYSLFIDGTLFETKKMLMLK